MKLKIFCTVAISFLVGLRTYQHLGTSGCILFDGENISFDASIVVCINSINIPPIMIINRIYETQILLSCSFFPS